MELFWPIGFFILGAAMLIWPQAMSPSPYSCDPGPYGGDLFDCLVGGEWGKPEAIVLCFVIALLTALPLIRAFVHEDDA